MIPTLTIETLSKAHNRNAFDCGNQALNHFLQKIARQHSEKGLSKTFVLIDAEQPTDIIAYMSLVVCEVLAEDIPHQWKNKYPKRIPAAKLAKLAVAHHQQRHPDGGANLLELIEEQHERHAVVQCLAGRLLDDGSVGHWVGEGNSHLGQIDAMCFEGL